MELEYNNDWQTQARGTNQNEYELYLDFTDDEHPKTYEEWMAS